MCPFNKAHDSKEVLSKSLLCFVFFDCSDNVDSNSMLEKSISAKEKIISELNMEIHNVEIALADERERHVAEIKKLNSVLSKKVKFVLCSFFYAQNIYFFLEISVSRLPCLMLACRSFYFYYLGYYH